ncbi:MULTISPECIES: hypothetical protein [Niastella]|uniref:Uncharacterized protein n=1 Tax=Niastella soli TaxID=2821487 RepID=A0ABS3YZ06_9BACT|nr:hypothetical protein [Niastella soli]MBO9203153.1 hypothetical protein [Niastella soli]
MKKIGEATILIVADVFPYVPFPIRSLILFCSRSIVNEEQSSFKKSYSWNSIFCSHFLFEYPPLEQKAGIVYSHVGIKMNIA